VVCLSVRVRVCVCVCVCVCVFCVFCISLPFTVNKRCIYKALIFPTTLCSVVCLSRRRPPLWAMYYSGVKLTRGGLLSKRIKMSRAAKRMTATTRDHVGVTRLLCIRSSSHLGCRQGDTSEWTSAADTRSVDDATTES